MLGGQAVFARIVANRSDMVEKVKLWKAGLDDVPIEVMKLPMQVYENVQRDLETARYKGDLEVDERLARRLLDARRAAKA